MKKRFSKTKFASLFLSVLILAIIVAPMGKAASPSISTDPTQGPAGSTVMVYIRGYPALDSVNITFGEKKLATATTDKWALLNVLINVPQLSSGTYDITASGSTGVASCKFVVTQSSSPTHISTPRSTSTGATPSHNPATASNEFSSTLIYGGAAIIAVVAVLLVFFMLRARGAGKAKRFDLLQKEEPPSYRPKPPPTPPSTPAPFASTITSKPYLTAAERYGRPTTYQPATYGQQSAKSSVTSRPTTPSYTPSYNQQSSSGEKICPHCKQTIRGDYNVCPYCYKRLK
jgi:hypothetical protein